MTGDSCLARAVVPRTAAAVDHADTELIGHGGQLETPGFFVVVWENESPAATPTCPPLFQGVAGFREGKMGIVLPQALISNSLVHNVSRSHSTLNFTKRKRI